MNKRCANKSISGILNTEVIHNIDNSMYLIKYYHEQSGGHSGINSTLDKLSTIYYWSGMKLHVQNYVSTHDYVTNIFNNTAYQNTYKYNIGY